MFAYYVSIDIVFSAFCQFVAFGFQEQCSAELKCKVYRGREGHIQKEDAFMFAWFELEPVCRNRFW